MINFNFKKKLNYCNVIFVKSGENIKELNCIECKVDLDKFPSLKKINLKKCNDLSWNKYSKCCSNVEFFSCIENVKTFDIFCKQWEMLKILNFKNNNLKTMNDTLKNLPSLEELDVSNNQLQNIEEFNYGRKLKKLNLSNNQIQSLKGITLKNLQILNLRNNKITNTKGIEILLNLKELDLGYNQIETWNQIKRLSKLVELQSLVLEGNLKLTSDQHYRGYVCGFFIGKDVFFLDGKKATRDELATRVEKIHFTALNDSSDSPTTKTDEDIKKIIKVRIYNELI